MKRLLSILAILLVLCLLFGGAYFLMYRQDLADHTGTLEIQMVLSAPEGSSGDPVPMAPGQGITFTIGAENLGYSPVWIRQTVILSVYDPQGNPLPLDGSTWTAASIDLCSTPEAQEPCPSRIIQNHQAIAVRQYLVGPAEQKYTLPFQPEYTASNTEANTCTVHLDAAAPEAFVNGTAVLEVILEGALSEAPDRWQLLESRSVVLGSGTSDNRHTTSQVPFVSDSPTSFQWELRDGTAYLTGIGSITDPDIVIPSQVLLSGTTDCREDPWNGLPYPVVVAGDAFYDCDSIQSVTFQDGVQIQNGRMYGNRGGMFENCDLLTGVHHLPDNVIGMKATFANCVAMTCAPALPGAVTDLENCFRGCTALMEVPALPGNVTGFYGTFQNCVSLVTAPVLPDSLTEMLYSFSGCTSLTEIMNLPEGLTNMTGCFQNCTALTQPPELPSSVTVLKLAFSGCTSLTNAPVIPAGVTDMTETFSGCTALTAAPELPDSIFYLQRCFKNCKSLCGIVSLPIIQPLSYEIAAPFRIESIQGMLDGCSQVEAIHIPYCDGQLDPKAFSETIPVVFVGEHQTDTVCPICHIANLTTEIDDVEVVIENIPEEIYLQFIDYFDHQVPDWLKAYCSKMTFTDDLGKYDRKYISGYAGFARNPEGTAYVLFKRYAWDAWPSFQGIPNTMVHELAHTYDHRYSTHKYESDSSEWRSIHAQEGETAASLWYDKQLYDSKSASAQRSETFAMALEEYFMDPGNLKRNCPRMYEYIHNLVMENQ